MKTVESKWRNIARTCACLGGGIFLSFFLFVALELLLQPKLPPWTSPEQPLSPEMWHDLKRFADVTVYVVGPLAGFGVGAFVGFFQKRRPATVAALCLVPSTLVGFVTDHRKNWARSASSISHYLFDQSLPFLAAIIAVLLCRYVVGYLRHRSIESKLRPLKT